jgi:septal ring factor EnvC (AmiA/AmiB activator)
MERNRWETAIRCLEIAVHPGTNDREVIAAINGFRRTAHNAPLRQLCREFAGAPSSGTNAVAADELQRLSRENLALRQKLEEADTSRKALLQRLHDAERHSDEIGEELVAAEHRADTAERQLAEFRGVYGRISGSLNLENDDLRRALAEARRNLAQPIHEPIAPFQAALNAALQRPDQSSPGQPAAIASHPWTA